MNSQTQNVELRYLTEVQAAEFLAMSPKTLRDWRFRRVGPPYKKLGDAGSKAPVRYRLEDLINWMEEASNVHEDK